MIELKTQHPRIATDGKNIFALFPDEEACSHCAARHKETHCGFINPVGHVVDRLLPKCDLMDEELDSYGTWKLVG